MTNRFQDALAIQLGACNIAGMARTLVSACDEVTATHGFIPNDPAIKLIVHQMAYIAGIISGVEEFYRGTYHDCDNACRTETVVNWDNQLELAYEK